MNKALFQEKARSQQEAEATRLKLLCDSVANTVEVSRLTAPESQYHPFEISLGSELFKAINNYLSSLDESEFGNYDKLNDPLLKVCQKFLDWKTEVGSERLWHELVSHSTVNQKSANESFTYVIRNAWEQVKKEYNIIETARQLYKDYLSKILEENPQLPNEDPAQWCSLCDGFSEFEALQEFKYPLPFDSVFEVMKSQEDDSTLLGE